MKIKMHKSLNVFNYITARERFKGLFFFALVLALYGGLALTSGIDNYIDAAISPFQFYIFNILFMALFLLNTLNTCTVFNRDFSYYIQRFENKKEYLRELIKNVLIMNGYLMLLFFMMYFLIINFTMSNHIELHNYYSYNISNFNYGLFYIIRYSIIVLLFNMITALVYVTLKGKVAVLLNIFILLIIFVQPSFGGIINHFSINIAYYFMHVEYSSFINEFSYSILFLFALEIVFYILYRIFADKCRWSIL